MLALSNGHSQMQTEKRKRKKERQRKHKQPNKCAPATRIRLQGIFHTGQASAAETTLCGAPAPQRHSPAGAVPGPEETHLQADGQVHSAAEGGAHGPRVQTQVFEELREGLRERYPRPLLGHHHTGPHARQVQSSCLQVTAVRGQPSGAPGWGLLTRWIHATRTSLRGLCVSLSLHCPGPARPCLRTEGAARGHRETQTWTK